MFNMMREAGKSCCQILGIEHMLDDLWVETWGFLKSVFMEYYLCEFLLYVPDDNYDYHSGAGCLHTLSHLFLTTPL